MSGGQTTEKQEVQPPEQSAVPYRYWLFACHLHHPHGGFDDFRGCFASVEEAVEGASSIGLLYCRGWWHIVDVVKQEVVKCGVWR